MYTTSQWTSDAPETGANVTTMNVTDMYGLDSSTIFDVSVQRGTAMFRSAATIFCSIQIFLITSLNLPLLFAILHLNRRKLKPAHIVILSLAIADLLAACVYLPFLIVVLQRGQAIECNGVCTTLVTLEKGSIAASVWGTAFISLDKYLFIVKHTSYLNKMTSKKMCTIIATVWGSVVVLSIVSYFQASNIRSRNGECVCNLAAINNGVFGLGFSVAFVVLSYILPIVMMCTMYSFVVRVAYVHSQPRQNRIGCSSGVTLSPRCAEGGRTPSMASRSSSILDVRTLQAGDYDIDRRDETRSVSVRTMVSPHVRVHEVKAAWLIILLLSLFVIFTTPYFAITILVSNDYWDPQPYFIHIISVLLFHSNSACNALLYGYTNRHLRESLVKFLRLKTSNKQNTDSREHQLSSRHLSAMGDGSSVALGSRCSSLMSGSSVMNEIIAEDMHASSNFLSVISHMRRNYLLERSVQSPLAEIAASHIKVTAASQPEIVVSQIKPKTAPSQLDIILPQIKATTAQSLPEIVLPQVKSITVTSSAEIPPPLDLDNTLCVRGTATVQKSIVQ